MLHFILVNAISNHQNGTTWFQKKNSVQRDPQVFVRVETIIAEVKQEIDLSTNTYTIYVLHFDLVPLFLLSQ